MAPPLSKEEIIISEHLNPSLTISLSENNFGRAKVAEAATAKCAQRPAESPFLLVRVFAEERRIHRPSQ